MDTLEVFALNIQSAQLQQVLPQYKWNKEGYEDERNYFIWWLKKQVSENKYNFSDQLSAWEAYARIHEIPEFDDDEEFTPSWMEEIEQAINQAVRVGNYNEYRGQL